MRLPPFALARQRIHGWICVGALAAALLPGPRSVAGADSSLAPAEQLLVAGRYAESEAAARQALAEIEARSGPESAELCPALDLICETGRLAAKTPLGELEPLAQRSLSIRTRAFGPSHPQTAVSLGTLSRLAYTKGDAVRAESLLTISLEILDRDPPPDPVELGRQLENFAALDLARGAVDEAIARLERSLSLREQTAGPESAEVARVDCLLAQARHAQGRYQEAIELVQRGIAIREKLGTADHPHTAWMLGVLSNLYLARGEFALARDYQERTLAMRIRLFGEFHPDVALSLNTLGAIERRFERYPEALEYHRRAVAVQEATVGHDHPFTAMFINNVAATLWMIGSTEEALPYAKSALEIRERLLPPGHPDLAQSHHSLGILYDELGRHAEALDMFRRALAEYEAIFGPTHPQVALTLGKLTESLTHLGQYDEALTYSTRALAIWEASETPDHPDHALVLFAHATILWRLHRADDALQTVDRAIEIYDRTGGPGHPIRSSCRLLRAEILGHLGRDDEALAIALETAQEENQQLRGVLPSLSEEHGLDLRNLRTDARDLAVSLVCQGRGGGPESVEQLWSLVVQSRSVVFDEMVRRQRPEQGEEPTARTAREEHRAASEELSDLLVARGEGEEIESAVIDSARATLDEADLRLRSLNPRFREDQEEGATRLTDARTVLPADAALVAFLEFEFSDLDTTAQTTTRERRYCAFVLPSSHDSPWIVDLGAAANIDSTVLRWRREAGNAVRESERASRERAYAEAARALAGVIWDPIQPALGAAASIFIVPDGALHLISWQALPSPDGSFLVEHGPLVRILNTERDLRPVQARRAAPPRLLALGDPDFDRSTPDRVVATSVTGAERAERGAASRCFELGHVHWLRLRETAKEIEETARVWQAQFGARSFVERLTRAEATEENLKRLAPECSVLHLATHAFFLDSSCLEGGAGTRGVGGIVEETAAETVEAPDETPPSIEREASVNASLHLSGLVLAGANRLGEGPLSRADSREDGILTAEEIGALDLSGVSWAVLSACGSGLGPVEAGEGVYGLRRAFQLAGASTVVSSIWSVDDAATRDWMEELYRARFAGALGAAESVRAASLATLADRRAHGRSDHPFYWAAFVATGDWR